MYFYPESSFSTLHHSFFHITIRIMNNPKIHLLIITIATLIFAGCAKNYPYLETVQSVDLNRYMGTWYEVASLPNSFQEGCNCSKAEYTLVDDEVKVLNTCRKDSLNGELDDAEGTATIVEGSNNAKLKVSFFWPFKGDYWIIDLAEDYSYAVVGTPSRKYLWVLSRTKTLPDSIYSPILQRAGAKGFDTSNVRKTTQECP